ncbi:MAG: 50S ribosomal protein L9 [Dehalococcoidia bacterium]|nr:50S ribosomal protein L9 [Dehalococcoidia bacterium]MQG16168.1 50S ribosomal protein L9 [SAR202 cluster bacterium]|tara:strand:+ start:22327 stop:22983 length:657 start_codon:yes stop_codon:yes gene_type:complete
MKVVFLEDVEGVANGGEVKDVRPGFARNYLIPKNLAVIATHDSLQRLDKLKNQAEKDRIKKLNDMTLLGEKLTGTRLDLEMRSGPGGRLYGSVTNTIVADKLSELLETDIDKRLITIPDSIRNVGLFIAKIRLHQEVDIEVELLVHPTDIDPETFVQQLADQKSSSDEIEAIDIESSSELDSTSAEHFSEENNEPQHSDETEPESDSNTESIVDEKKS